MKATSFTVTLFLFISLSFGGCTDAYEHQGEIPIVPESPKPSDSSDLPDIPEPPDNEFEWDGGWFEVTIPEDIPEVACHPDLIFGEKADITGKWQLLNVYEGYKGQNEEIDFSCDMILYEFFPDGICEVSSKVERFPQGVYTYEFKGNLMAHPLIVREYPERNLRIGEEGMTCTVMKSVMSISTLTDGIFTGGMFFARIK